MLICAALSKAPSRLELDGFSADIEATVRCLEALGRPLRKNRGRAFHYAAQQLPGAGAAGCGRKRVDAAVSAAGARCARRSGGGSDAWRLPERPLSPLWEVLEAHGMRLRQDGIVLYTDGQLCAGDYSLPGDVSSQFISGLLFALPLLGENSTLTVTGALQSARYVAMTEQALAAAGFLQKRMAKSGRSTAGSAMPRLPCRQSRATGRTRRFSCAWARCLQQA